ncbi:MAG: fructose-6-phosphate aldolase [Acidobacteria bacterium]|nr:fructose-6-phosphate aldolase [Acidobacteriota bacterium]
MKFFIDTANLKEIREAVSWGLVDGVTTNPSLVAKEGRDFHELLLEICRAVNGPVSAEVVSTLSEGMVAEGRELASIHDRIVVKTPLTPEGIKACKILTTEGIRVNVTLVFSPVQAILAAKAGAAFVSPFVGRLDDVGASGMDLAADIVQIFRNYDFKTEVLVASVRNPVHVAEAARMGAHVATMPFKVIEQLFKHPLTDVGLERFLADWEKAHKEREATIAVRR